MQRIETAAMHAFVREPSQSLSRCELTHLPRTSIDVALAGRQHANYVECLRSLGATIDWLPPLDEQPDSVFVEDTAIVFPELIVLAWPGVRSRQAEVASVASSLSKHRKVHAVAEPGYLDGGDVLTLGRRVLVGLSTRTNEAGVAQMRAALRPFGYLVEAVRVTGCLHLKSACTAIDASTVVANLDYIDHKLLGDVRVIEVDPREPRAANTLTLDTTTLISRASPATAERLVATGIKVAAIDVSELEKAEAGLTCMSLLLMPN